VAATTLVLLLPAVDTFYQFAQPRPGSPDSEIFAMIAIPVVLLSLVVGLIQAFWWLPAHGERQRVTN